MTNPFVARFASEPALVNPLQTDRFKACLDSLMADPNAAKLSAERADTAEDDFWSQDDWRAAYRPYVIKDGVLQIPVKGVLLHNFSYAVGAWATGYDYIWRAFQRGCGDFTTGVIKGIGFIEDTPGGMVAGCFDAVDRMVALKQKTGVQVRAFAHESAYSAGYAIATVADHIVVSRTGGVGSIGVVTSHMDVSGAMEKAGYKITFIASDPSKVEGNSYEPLSAKAEARIQVRMDELYGVFVAAVARSRGLEETAIRGDLKAYCYTATQAVSNGLADSIGSLDDSLAAFATNLSNPTTDGENEDMTTENKNTHTQADIDAARTDEQNKTASAVAAAQATERARVAGITGHAEAKGRETLATYIAMNTDMSVEAAVKMLEASPKIDATAPVTADAGATFAAAMEGNNPDVGAARGKDKDVANSEDKSGDVLKLVASAGIVGFITDKK